jgi:hypothetical protein
VSEVCEGVAKLTVAIVVLTVLVMLQRTRQSAFLERHRRTVLWSLTAAGALAYVNFAQFHSDGSTLHPWEQLQDVLGSKYFAELGYDGLYAGMLRAREEQEPPISLPTRVRDLRTMEIGLVTAQTAHREDVRARFGDARWREFARDATAVYVRDEFFLDSGYVSTPAHTAVSRLLTRWLSFGRPAMIVCASVGFVFLALGFWAVAAWVNVETLAAVVLMFGLGICTRYHWVGGAFFRQDWFAALLVAGAALRSRRFATAGAAIGYASLVRIFPALFLLPIGVFAVAAHRRGSTRYPWRRFVTALGAVGSTLFVAGCVQGRGVAVWREFAHRLVMHAGSSFPNAIGLRVPLITSWRNLRGEFVNTMSLHVLDRVERDYSEMLHERWWLVALVALFFTGLSVEVARRTRSPEVAFAAGVGLVFSLTAPPCYCGSFFVLLALWRPLWTAAAFIIATLAMYVVAGLVFVMAARGALTLNGAAVFAFASVGLAIVLVTWLIRVFRASV